MKRLETIEGKVKKILNNSPETRDDDMMLYLYVCNACLNNRAGELSLSMIMTQYRSLGIPCFESVRRTRQKLQAKYPELSSSKRIKRQRSKQEGIYKKYAKKQ